MLRERDWNGERSDLNSGAGWESIRVARIGSELRKWARASSISGLNVKGLRVLGKRGEFFCDGFSWLELMETATDLDDSKMETTSLAGVLEESFRIFVARNGILEKLEGF